LRHILEKLVAKLLEALKVHANFEVNGNADGLVTTADSPRASLLDRRIVVVGFF
jgi:hypothetical protein